MVDAVTAKKAAQVLHQKGCSTVIVTMGAKGAYISSKAAGKGSDKDLEELIPARAVKAIDTTGAGDVFSGALAAALSEGKILKEAVRFACDAASISVTRYGTQPSIPHRHEL